MANKTLHSLQFPGLSDVYVVPEDAQEFSSESTYAVGEFVTYQGVLYKCTTAVTTAGSWTGATNWSATDVGTELQDTYGPSRPNFSVNNPLMDGTASPGSATTYARSDHIHPSDTSKLDIPENSGTAGQVLTKTASGSIWQTQSSGGEIIAAASNSYSVTLYANSWTTQEQLIATPTGAQITSTSDGVLGLSPNATAAQVEAFQLAKIVVISQSASGVVVKALGIVPTINLPCELMIFMKADYYTKDYIDTYMAPLDTPTFIGVPKAPTAAAGTNTTQIATTAFVEQAKKTRVPVIGKGVNLLRNWYFIGGGTGRGVFPINQRGLTSYTSPSGNRTIDGWLIRTSGSSVVIDSNYITFNRGETSERADFYQILGNNLLQKIYGKYVTLSLLLGDGRFIYSSFIWSSSSITRIEQSDFIFNAGNGPTYGSDFSTFFLRLTGASLNIIAIKLELGSEQTLCHNEGTDANPVWVLNDVPDYEYELYRCMTSTADPNDAYANKSLATEQQLAYVENGSTASRAYAVGEYFCWHGSLYRAKTAIGNGDMFTVNTNCEQDTVGAELNSLSKRLMAFELTNGKSLQIRLESNSSRLQCLAASSGARTTTAILYFLSLYSTNSTYHIISPIITGSNVSVSTSGGVVTITNNHPSDIITIMLQIFGIEGTITYTVV